MIRKYIDYFLKKSCYWDVICRSGIELIEEIKNVNSLLNEFVNRMRKDEDIAHYIRMGKDDLRKFSSITHKTYPNNINEKLFIEYLNLISKKNLNDARDQDLYIKRKRVFPEISFAKMEDGTLVAHKKILHFKTKYIRKNLIQYYEGNKALYNYDEKGGATYYYTTTCKLLLKNKHCHAFEEKDLTFEPGTQGSTMFYMGNRNFGVYYNGINKTIIDIYNIDYSERQRKLNFPDVDQIINCHVLGDLIFIFAVEKSQKPRIIISNKHDFTELFTTTFETNFNNITYTLMPSTNAREEDKIIVYNKESSEIFLLAGNSESVKETQKINLSQKLGSNITKMFFISYIDQNELAFIPNFSDEKILIMDIDSIFFQQTVKYKKETVKNTSLSKDCFYNKTKIIPDMDGGYLLMSLDDIWTSYFNKELMTKFKGLRYFSGDDNHYDEMSLNNFVEYKKIKDKSTFLLTYLQLLENGSNCVDEKVKIVTFENTRTNESFKMFKSFLL